VRTLLIDADVLVYRYASAHQQVTRWDEDRWTYVADFGAARADLNNFLAEIVEALEADRHVLAVSDSKHNWRRDVWSGYKGHRAGWLVRSERGLIPPKAGPQRPMLWAPLREYLIDDLGAVLWDGMEGDDVMGILATEPARGEERIIVSPDKDMRTVPGPHFNPDTPLDGVWHVQPLEAVRFHLLQTLMGDPTDGYPGCRGIGPKKAEKILAGAANPEAAWERIVEAYEKADMTEDDALRNARVARVLQHGEYNHDTMEIKLWQPPR
jgi:DNA polymerase-1